MEFVSSLWSGGKSARGRRGCGMRGVQSRAQYTERFDWNDTHATPLPRSRRKMGFGLIALTVRKIGSHKDQRVAHVRLVPPLQFDGIFKPWLASRGTSSHRNMAAVSRLHECKKFEGDLSRDVRGYPLTLYTERSLYSSRFRKKFRKWSISYVDTRFRVTHGYPFSVSFFALTAADSRHRELVRRIFTDLNDEKGYWMNSWNNDPETEKIQILAIILEL